MRALFTPKRLVAGAVAVAVVLGAVAAVSARSENDPSYRTATASKEDVDQVLQSVGTVEPVSQASVAFPVAGTVASLYVKVGDDVTVGRQLATLDTEDLTDTVHTKQAALDQAELTLSLALAGEDVGSVSGGSSPTGSNFNRPASSGSDAELKAAQQAVLDAQKAVDEATAAAQQAFDTATAVCAEPATSPAADDTTTSTTTVTSDDSSAACLAALQAVLDAQQAVSDAQKQLTDAASDLTKLLDELASGTGTTTTTVPSGGGSGGGNGSSGNGGGSGSFPSGSTGSTGSSGGSGSTGSPSGSGSTSPSPSAEDLIAYQKKVDAATDELAVAQQSLDQATIVSPIDGTVASVGFAVGDDVTAASATQTIVIVGKGGFEVTTSISVKHLPDIKVGQPASVTPDGQKKAIEGQVVRIGVSPQSSSSSTTTYAVTIALTGDTSSMGNGSTAAVSIVTDAAERALAVPTSAITVDGTRSTVQKIVDGKATTTTVKTGAVGQTWTQITDGLSAGDTVVLAELNKPLPGSATDSSSNGSSNQRQFPGGGSFTFPGGGTGGPPSGLGGTRPGG